MKFKSYLMDILLLSLFAYLFLIQLYTIWPFTIDDMYISLRYAKHWAGPVGLLWNPGMPPVEGYSNFSFVVLATLAIKANLNPVIVLKIVGVAGLAMTCIALTCISRLWLAWRIALIPSLCLLFYRGQILWTVSGLETAFYQALLAFAVFFALRALGYCFYPLKMNASKPSDYFLSGILLSLAAMTRPEAPVFMALFFLFFLMERPKGYRRGLAYFILSIALFYLPYFIWHLLYYNRLFPNPVYCKGMDPKAWFVLDLNFLALAWPFLLLSLFSLKRLRTAAYLFLAAPSLMYCILLVGADPIVAFENRLFLPAFSLILPLALIGLDDLLFNALKARDNLQRLTLCVISLLLCLYFIPWFSLEGYRYFSKAPLAGEQLRAEVVDWLGKNARPNQEVLLGDSGYIPYYSDQIFIDSYCLNNAEMVRYPQKTRVFMYCEAILKKKPAIIILTSLIQNGETIFTPVDACLSLELTKKNAYSKTMVFEKKEKNSAYRYEVFRKF